MDAASKRFNFILDTFSAENDDDAKDDIMPSYVFNRGSRSLFGSFLTNRRRRPATATTNQQASTSSPASSSLSLSSCRYGFDIAILDPASDLPSPVTDLLFFLESERKSFRNNGDIFRVQTSSIDVKMAAIIKAYDEERPLRIDSIGVDKRDNVAAAFGALVAYFQAMPRPLVPFAFMNFVLSQDWYRLDQDEVIALHDDFVQRLPLVNYRILRKLVSSLRQICIWAFDKQNEEAPIWLVSLFRFHWRAFYINSQTNSAIYIASFVALHVFRSGLGCFSPDNDGSALFHFRASCFLAQLMVHFDELFLPKRKKPSSKAVDKTSTDKCSRNEVGYENELADTRLQQITALSAHLGRLLELSNQMTTIADDSANRTASVLSIRKRADAVATKLDAMGIDCLNVSVEKSSESLSIYLDKHNLFPKRISLSNLQRVLFKIRTDTSNYDKAVVALNLRDYVTFLVNIEGAVCRLVARKFVETTDILTEMIMSGTPDDMVSTAESLELIFEPEMPQLETYSRSPSFLSPATGRKAISNNDSASDGTKSEKLSILMLDPVSLEINENNYLGPEDATNVSDFIKTPSPSSDIDDLVRSKNIIEVQKLIMSGVLNGNTKHETDLDDLDGDSSFADNTPTPNTTPPTAQTFSASKFAGLPTAMVSSRRSSSGAISGEYKSPKLQASPHQPVLPSFSNTSSNRSQSILSASSSSASKKITLPGLYMGSLYQQQSQSASPRWSCHVSPTQSTRASCHSGRVFNGRLSSNDNNQQRQRYSYVPQQQFMSTKRQYQPSLETNV